MFIRLKGLDPQYRTRDLLVRASQITMIDEGQRASDHPKVTRVWLGPDWFEEVCNSPEDVARAVREAERVATPKPSLFEQVFGGRS
jgi:hypothetical protein